METQGVRCEAVGRTWVVTIDRADVRNAVDRATADALTAAFDTFEADPSLSVAILTGAHGTFCAGADLKAIARSEPNRLSLDGDGPMGPTRRVLSKPCIAAIAGHAVAGGLELALWCDLRVAEEDAVLGVFCRRWGVPLIDGGTVRLPRIVGFGRALDLILTGRAVDAAEALAIGLVNRVVPKGTSLDHALALAAQIAAHPEVCTRNDRLSAYASLDLPFAQALAREFELGTESLTQGAAEGAARFRDGAGRHGRGTE